MAARVLLVVLIIIVLAAVGFAVYLATRGTDAGTFARGATGTAAPAPAAAGTVLVLASPLQHAVTTPTPVPGGLSIGSGTDLLGELRLL